MSDYPLPLEITPAEVRRRLDAENRSFSSTFVNRKSMRSVELREQN